MKRSEPPDLSGIKLKQDAGYLSDPQKRIASFDAAIEVVKRLQIRVREDGFKSLPISSAVPSPETAENQAKWPEVNKALCQVRWEDTCHSLSVEATTLFSKLVEAKGEYIAAGSVVTKPARIFKQFPPELQALIDRSNKGYRLKISE